jgi:hypothetical protein
MHQELSLMFHCQWTKWAGRTGSAGCVTGRANRDFKAGFMSNGIHSHSQFLSTGYLLRHTDISFVTSRYDILFISGSNAPARQRAALLFMCNIGKVSYLNIASLRVWENWGIAPHIPTSAVNGDELSDSHFERLISKRTWYPLELKCHQILRLNDWYFCEFKRFQLPVRPRHWPISCYWTLQNKQGRNTFNMDSLTFTLSSFMSS